jgi:hypothetical protein
VGFPCERIRSGISPTSGPERESAQYLTGLAAQVHRRLPLSWVPEARDILNTQTARLITHGSLDGPVIISGPGGGYMRIRLIVSLLACVSVLGLGLSALGAADPASATSLPKVIQRCGHTRACVSIRPSRFKIGGDTITRIHWQSYGRSRAKGHSPTYGGFGVKVVFFSPVTSHGRHYFKRVFFQTAMFGSCLRWTWSGDKYVTSRYCPFT